MSFQNLDIPKKLLSNFLYFLQNQSDQNFACEESSDFEMFEDSFSSVSESDSDYYTQNKKSVEGKYGMLVFSLTIEGDSCPIASFPK